MKHEVLLISDEQCAVCNAYCQRVHIRESVGTLTLVNAREDGAVIAEITRRGPDIDQGMALKVGDVRYRGWLAPQRVPERDSVVTAPCST